MNATPRVSVVLPTFNRAAQLPRSIGSVLRQSFTDLELLLVDDGSTEDVEAVARAIGDPRVRYLRRSRGGVAAARNTGIAAARGRDLAFQDSDDEWLPDKLARQVEVLDAAGAGRHMIVCGLVRVDGGRERRYPGSRATRLTHEDVLQRPFAYAQSWLVSREAVLAAGAFDESLQVWEDWELLMRLSARLEIRVLTEVLVRSRVSDDGLSRDQERFIRSMECILEKHAVALAGQPRALAQLRYVQGRLLGRAGRGAAARAAFARALRLDPLHWRAATLLAASFAGAPGLQRLLEIAERRS